MVESTGDPESGGKQESGGGQEVELYQFPLLLNQGISRTVKGLQGGRPSGGNALYRILSGVTLTYLET